MRVIAAILCLCIASISCAQSKEGSKEEGKKATEGKSTAADNKCCSQSAPVTITVSPTISPAFTAHEQAERKADEEEKNTIWEALTSVSTFALAVITAFLATFTYWLWDANKTLIEGAKDTAERQLRAYVALDDIYFRWKHDPTNPDLRYDIFPTHDDGGLPRPRIRVKNFGKSPAHNVVVRMNGEVFRNPSKSRIQLKREYDEGRNYPAPVYFLGPSQVWGMWIHLKGGDRSFDYKTYDRHAESLLIWGAIIYDDAYEKSRVTEFCFVYDGSNRFLPYGGEYNKETEYESRKEAEGHVYGPY